jgi:hypothetical protein
VNKFVLDPFSIKDNFPCTISIRTCSISFSFQELTLVAITILVYHYTIAHFILFEPAVKEPTIVELVLSYKFFIVSPLSLEFIAICVSVYSISLSFAILDISLIELILEEIYSCLSKHQIFFELSFIFCLILPFVSSRPLF